MIFITLTYDLGLHVRHQRRLWSGVRAGIVPRSSGDDHGAAIPAIPSM
jgi:hypothetical protein